MAVQPSEGWRLLGRVMGQSVLRIVMLPMAMMSVEVAAELAFRRQQLVQDVHEFVHRRRPNRPKEP